MEKLTLTMAGQQALAGGARLSTGARVRPGSPLASGSAVHAAHGAYGHLTQDSWNVGRIAEPTTTFTVFDGKHRPTRQPSELSP